jgi:hypothetical protein
MVRAEECCPVVLVVEDEFILRMEAVNIASEAGATVVEAANADAEGQ